MINYFFKYPHQMQNCRDFAANTADFPSIDVFQPAPHKAPWHVQALLGDGSIELNFWPHKLKGQRAPFPAVMGKSEIRELIREAQEDAAEPDFDLIED